MIKLKTALRYVEIRPRPGWNLELELETGERVVTVIDKSPYWLGVWIAKEYRDHGTGDEADPWWQ